MFGLSAIFIIVQIGLAYYLIHLRKVEKVKKLANSGEMIKKIELKDKEYI